MTPDQRLTHLLEHIEQLIRNDCRRLNKSHEATKQRLELELCAVKAGWKAALDMRTERDEQRVQKLFSALGLAIGALRVAASSPDSINIEGVKEVIRVCELASYDYHKE
jgi:hypothetical protein